MNRKQAVFDCGVYLRHLKINPYRRQILAKLAGKSITNISRKEYEVFIRKAPKGLSDWEKRSLFIVATNYANNTESDDNRVESIYKRISEGMETGVAATVKKTAAGLIRTKISQTNVFEKKISKLLVLLTQYTGSIDYEQLYADLCIWPERNMYPQKHMAAIICRGET